MAGRVKEVRVKAGDKIKLGQPVLVVEDDGRRRRRLRRPRPRRRRTASPPPAAEAPAAATARGKGPGEGDSPTDRSFKAGPGEGDGPTDRGKSQRRRAPADEPADRKDKVLAFAASRPTAAATDRGPLAPAAPVTAPAGARAGRRSRPGPRHRAGRPHQPGRRQDLHQQVMSSLGGGGQASVATLSGGSVALPDFSKWGAVERKPLTGIRRKTAEHLSHAWNAIPHVTQHDQADITELERCARSSGPRSRRPAAS